MNNTHTSTETTPEADLEYRRLLEQESLITDATELIYELMEERGLNQKQLAKKIGKSKGFVSQVLSGRRNMTLRTLSDLLFALGARGRLEPTSLDAPRAYRTSSGTSATPWRGAGVFEAAMRPLMAFDAPVGGAEHVLAPGPHHWLVARDCEWERSRQGRLKDREDRSRWMSLSR
jgi:transcriptional regulator with XRE-family HTH domain